MLNVIYEDNHLLVVDKPSGIATMGSLSGESMHSRAADYLRDKYNKPGKVFVGIVSRLDTMTSGVLVMARTSKAASRLAPQFGGGSKKPANRASKVYLVAVEGKFSEATHRAEVSGNQKPETVRLADHVWKDDSAHRMRVVSPGKAGAQLAEMNCLVLDQSDETTLMAVRLNTGRKHQIRVQLAHRGHKVLGDRKYGSDSRFSQGIALHSFLLQIDHPTLKDRREFIAPVPASWKQFSHRLPSLPLLRDTVGRAFDLPESATQI